MYIRELYFAVVIKLGTVSHAVKTCYLNYLHWRTFDFLQYRIYELPYTNYYQKRPSRSVPAVSTSFQREIHVTCL